MSLAGVRVAAVFGSMSPEHEISVITACQAMPVLRELGATVIPIYITKQGRWITDPAFAELGTFRERLPDQGDPVSLDLAAGRFMVGASSLLARPRELPVDVIFPLVHGGHGEDGTLAALAALARIPLAGCGTLAGALAMDKYRSKQLLHALGQPVVPGRLLGSASEAPQAAAGLAFPLVAKPNRSGSSIGVTLVESPETLAAAVELAFQFDGEVLLEPAVPAAQDLNCAVKTLSPRASEVERPLKGEGVLSYADKYATDGRLAPKVGGPAGKGKGDGRHELPAAIPDELRARIQTLAVQAFDALGCRGTARVDFLLSEAGQLYVNEINTLPGSLAFYLWEASGVTFPALLEELVREGTSQPPARRLALPGNLLAADGVLGK
ncbi:MAG: D-alanine--D-alanine ligase [Candidatus Dormibacteria bacterium]